MFYGYRRSIGGIVGIVADALMELFQYRCGPLHTQEPVLLFATGPLAGRRGTQLADLIIDNIKAF